MMVGGGGGLSRVWGGLKSHTLVFALFLVFGF